MTVETLDLSDGIDTRVVGRTFMDVAKIITGQALKFLGSTFKVRIDGGLEFSGFAPDYLRNSTPPFSASQTAQKFNPLAAMHAGLQRLYLLAKRRGPKALGPKGHAIYAKLHELSFFRKIGSTSSAMRRQQTALAGTIWRELPAELKRTAISDAGILAQVTAAAHQTARARLPRYLGGLRIEAGAIPEPRPKGTGLFQVDREIPIVVSGWQAGNLLEQATPPLRRAGLARLRMLSLIPEYSPETPVPMPTYLNKQRRSAALFLEPAPA